MPNFVPLANAGVDESNIDGQVQLYAGEADIITTEGYLDTGYEYEAGQVLGRVTATGRYAPFDSAAVDGTEKAVGVMAGEVLNPLYGAKVPIYVGGVFNIDALIFDGTLASDEEKIGALVGTNIVAQRLYGSVPPESGGGK